MVANSPASGKPGVPNATQPNPPASQVSNVYERCIWRVIESSSPHIFQLMEHPGEFIPSSMLSITTNLCGLYCPYVGVHLLVPPKRTSHYPLLTI